MPYTIEPLPELNQNGRAIIQQQCRVTCGADVIIRHVLPYLISTGDDVLYPINPMTRAVTSFKIVKTDVQGWCYIRQQMCHYFITDKIPDIIDNVSRAIRRSSAL